MLVWIRPEEFGLSETDVEPYPINPNYFDENDLPNYNALISLALSKGWARCNLYRGNLFIHGPDKETTRKATNAVYRQHAESVYEITVEFGPDPKNPIWGATADNIQNMRLKFSAI